MPEFTSSQLELLSRKRKAPGKRPRIYSLTSLDDTEIGLDTEAFLILAPDVGKANMSMWANVVLQNLPSPATRDQVVIEILLEEQADSVAVQSAMQPFQLAWDQAKSSMDPGPFATIPEVQQIFSDLSRYMGPIEAISEFSNYQSTLGYFYTFREVVGFGDADVEQNIRSIVAAINAYR